MWKYRVYFEGNPEDKDLRSFSRGLHRMVINWFDRQNHALTNEIKTDNTLRPFCINFFRKDKETGFYYFDISIIDEKKGLEKLLTSSLENSCKESEEIDLNYSKFKVKSFKPLVQKSYFELLETARLKKEFPKIKVEFLTETIFNYKLKGTPKSLKYCLPDRELIFDSLVSRWNSFCISRFSPDEVRDYIISNIQILETNIRTESFSLGYSNSKEIVMNGFKGYIVFENTGQDESWDNIIKTLLLYGSWSGVGKKTAFGMGQLRVSFFK